MTHPMYQQQPPQGYAPQQQYGAPQGAPWMPPQYGGAPAQAAPVGGQPMPTSAPALGTSSRTGEGGPKFPQPRHLIGRTVIFEPIRIDETTKDDAGELRPTAHYHLTVVDGGPLEYGDNKSQKIADQHGYTMRTEVPARFVSCSSDRWGIVQEVRDAMARGELATVGVIVQGTRGTKGSPPFLVTRPGVNLDGKERPDGDQRFAAATQVWNAIFAKTFRSPEPVSLVAPPTQQPPQVAYQPTYPQQQPTQAALFQPTYNPQAAYPQGLNVEQPAYNPQAYAAPAPVQDPQYAAYLAAQQAQQQSAPPVDPQYAAWLQAQQQGQPVQGGPGI